MKHDKKLVRFYLPLQPEDAEQSVWSVIRIPPKNAAKSVGEGERVTTHLREIADANPLLKGIIDRVDFNATTHGQRDLDDDRLSNLIEAISAKRMGLPTPVTSRWLRLNGQVPSLATIWCSHRRMNSCRSSVPPHD